MQSPAIYAHEVRIQPARLQLKNENEHDSLWAAIRSAPSKRCSSLEIQLQHRLCHTAPTPGDDATAPPNTGTHCGNPGVRIAPSDSAGVLPAASPPFAPAKLDHQPTSCGSASFRTAVRDRAVHPVATVAPLTQYASYSRQAHCERSTVASGNYAAAIDVKPPDGCPFFDGNGPPLPIQCLLSSRMIGGTVSARTLPS